MEYSADGIRLINDIRRITRPDNDSVAIDSTRHTMGQDMSMAPLLPKKMMLKQVYDMQTIKK